ncbi:MAG: YncE family protein [Planctomycetes bacterium]|nr:YncE family protein [Planctomycetota bacterium]
MNIQRLSLSLVCMGVLVAQRDASAQSFVNWENAHVHPLEMTPDGSRLLAVNTADDRLEVFSTSGAQLVRLASIPVGIDPVSVRARTNDEVWVVNHISDSVSIVSLSAGNVVATIKTDDEPDDVVFAGSPQRAFVSCSQANKVQVFDPAALATAPVSVPLLGEDPRALAVSADGTRVYVAIFESGNGSTILGGGLTMSGGFPKNVVSDTTGPYGGQNPPPNAGTAFNPPINGALPPAPRVGLIVRKNSAGQWMDDNAHNWTAMVSGPDAAKSDRPVGWDLYDNDLAVIDVATLSVTYTKHLMNICMAVGVNPVSGEVCVVGTDGTNEVRFEPIVNGKFVRVKAARVSANGLTTLGNVDLNPHLTYATPTIPQVDRDKSIGDPRGIAWNAAGNKAYIAGMGSNNVIVIDSVGARAGIADAIPVGEGPTGIVVDDANARVFVLEKFAARVSTISTATETVVGSVSFYDPTPVAIKVGRKHLYDTHKNSGLGQAACGSCHVDSRTDGLAWDLGDPSGTMAPVAGNNLAAGIPGLTGGFQDFHPMKGPMTTQTLQDIIGKEPLHWRGDRKGIEDFNPAFQGLQGDDAQLTATEMQEFENFLATITFPPNPYRNFDNTLPTNLALPGHFTSSLFGPAGQPLPNGNAQTGLSDYRTVGLDGGAIRCVTCHTLPTGAGTDYTLVGATFVPIAPGPNGERHLALVSQDGSTNVSIKIPQVRNAYEKVGFDLTQMNNTRGFGFLHDGSVDSMARFLSEPAFTFTSNQQIANMTAFMMAFAGPELPLGSTSLAAQAPPGPSSRDTHAAVGRQLTLSAAPTASESTLLSSMTTLASANKVGLVMKGVRGGLARGARFLGGTSWQTDRASETLTTAQLTSGAAIGGEITFTVVPKGTEVRIGTDRDLDGWLDRDELDLGSDPADPTSFPGAAGAAFCLGDGTGAPCGCANNSNTSDAAGCLNVGATGGKLVAAGMAKISADTLVLSGSGMPNGGALYFQGTTQMAGGTGITFGDGKLCVTGSIIRLAIKFNVASASQYPTAGDPSLSTAGLVTVAGTRNYQIWYRDAAVFCTGDTYNLSNGWKTVWAP